MAGNYASMVSKLTEKDVLYYLQCVQSQAVAVDHTGEGTVITLLSGRGPLPYNISREDAENALLNNGYVRENGKFIKRHGQKSPCSEAILPAGEAKDFQPWKIN